MNRVTTNDGVLEYTADGKSRICTLVYRKTSGAECSGLHRRYPYFPVPSTCTMKVHAFQMPETSFAPDVFTVIPILLLLATGITVVPFNGRQ